ncbi:MAG: phosphatidylserine decarboxylase [Fusobacteria bacterium]|jgi:phosphatidylserine decarboxylase|nr:phosphatidylserine decarboxylase [Fusobacteriota bacterium]
MINLFLMIILILVLIIFIHLPKNIEKIIYIDRQTGDRIVEKVPGEFYLKWLYYNPFGKLCLNLIVKRKIISTIYGNKMDNKKSKLKILDFINKYDINVDESLKKIEDFNNFNEFFYRELKKNSRKISNSFFISPADGKIIVFENIDKIDNFFIKGEKFNLKEYLNDEILANEYSDGSIAIIRLAPTDYHRFHFPLDGRILKNNKIVGDYYSVSPLALGKKINYFFKNKREYTILNNDKIGNVIISEVGATMVGSIIQTFTENSFVEKGSEKGYFKFGGSTVILIFKKGQIKFDKDIIENTISGYETKILMGESIGNIL